MTKGGLRSLGSVGRPYGSTVPDSLHFCVFRLGQPLVSPTDIRDNPFRHRTTPTSAIPGSGEVDEVADWFDSNNCMATSRCLPRSRLR